MEETKQVSEEEILGDFSLTRVDIIDPETKRVTGKNPYTLYCLGTGKYVEHPVGSKNLWYENRKFCGRIDLSDPVTGPKVLIGTAHIPYTPPLTEDAKFAAHVKSIEDQNTKLLAELSAIKTENKAAAAIPVATAHVKTQTVKGRATPGEVL